LAFASNRPARVADRRPAEVPGRVAEN
jgi:hypothetical protein